MEPECMKNQLGQMMREVPDYDMVWDDWTKKCRGIFRTDFPRKGG
jgi:hypothetical protein